MFKKNFLKFQIFSIILEFILGTLLHFTFEWSNNNLVVASFSAVNESTWEHLKLIYFPMLLTTIIGYLYFGKNISYFLCSKVIGILVAMCFTVTFFYTYTGILGTNLAFLNIGSFFVAILLGEYIVYKMLNSIISCNPKIAVLALLILLFLFVIFTYFPPSIGLFQDPVTNKFGIIEKLSFK